MTVKKPMPCSLYDMEGIQSWLDELARQGLFLQKFSYHRDRAVFEAGEPAPVRFRLDPIVPGYDHDERKELYAQAGWELAATVTGLYCVYSCADPSVPELYTDPQSLSCAVKRLFRRLLRKNGLFFLVLAFLTACLLFVERKEFVRNLLLGERPLQPLVDVLLVVSLVLAAIGEGRYLKRLWTVCRTLEQGLPLKAGRRWNRPRYLAWFIPVYVLVSLSSKLALNYSAETLYTYQDALLSHPWPTAVQLEQAPGDREFFQDGYLVKNSSRLAPVQEFASLNQPGGSPRTFYTTIRYVRANSPGTAEKIYRLERDERADKLEQWQTRTYYPSRITDLEPLAPRDWPGLDRLEVARFVSGDDPGWCFTLLRGNDVLLVSCTNSARWEDCLPLFLEALDKEATP